MINSKFRTWVQASVWAATVIVLFLGLANTIVGMVSGNAWQSQAGIWQILASAFLTQALDNKKK